MTEEHEPNKFMGDDEEAEAIIEAMKRKPENSRPHGQASTQKSLPSASSKWPTHPDWWIDHEDEILSALRAMSLQEAVEWAQLNGFSWAKTKPAVIREVQQLIDRLAVSKRQTDF